MPETLKFHFEAAEGPVEEASNVHAKASTEVGETIEALRAALGDAIGETHVYAREHTVFVRRERIRDVCRHLKEELGFTYLIDIAGVDRFTEEERFEVFYGLVNIEAGRRIRVKVRVEEDHPVVPSVTPLFEAANWNERECFDMMGIRFEGHPDLRRMYMPEDFEWHPQRKEFPLLGIPGSLPLPSQTPEGPLVADPFAAAHGSKPVKSFREPEAAAVESATLSDDVFSFWPRHNEAVRKRLESKDAWLQVRRGTAVERTPDALEHEMTLNIGPQHPATHGVLRCVVKLDGERIEKCVLDIGYLHRGIEKLAESKTYQEFMPYTDRMDYLAPYANNVAWCMAVEKLVNIEVPERAQWIRMIMCELARISSHFLWLGVGLMDAGAVSVFLWTFQGREDLYNIFDELAGARFTVSHSRIGGLASDLTPRALALIRDFVDRYGAVVQGWRKLLNRNRIWVDRNKGVGVVTADEALALGLTGPNLRGSGVPYDIRIFEPYLHYDEVDFTIPLREEGDCLARYHVRMEEMLESLHIIRQCLDRLPDGPIRADDAKRAYPSKSEVYYSMEGMIHDFMYTETGVVPPKGASAYHAIESPKGELGFHLESDGTGNPWRARINAPSFTNLQGLESMMEGHPVADIVVLIGSIDPVMGEADK